MSLWHELAGMLPFEWASYSFMRSALLAVLLLAPSTSLLGCLIVNNKMAFFSEAVGHATLTGLALGVVLGLGDPTVGMTGFAILLAIGLSYLRRLSAASTDTIIGLVMSFSVALGVVLLSRGGSFAKYSRYLVGDLLTVSGPELARLGWILLIVLLVWLFFFNRFLVTFLGHSLARSRGVRVWLTEGFFASLVALVVASAIPWVGLLVVNSLIIIPAATARNLASDTRQYVFWALIFALLSGVTGLILSFCWGTAAGATIVLVAIAFYALSLAKRR